ncbi:membrane protein [Leuconostoc litchii]|uniref:DUF1129 domain-containing protein n=1 Tax=Leuconostoc litchii TaxID=1981069 RepID=A0A6P2CQ82_9LACO|nr:DUF1129 family protein [Leuconostoc litchii]TYC47553.1 DUF1129 domain-containing protein [Leuconostoc litchii]GMA69586.1 membrane protein [Leuconostoc litchii]
MSEQKKELTKKNQDFIFQFKKQLAKSSKLNGEKIEEIVAEVEAHLLETQGKGQTAAQIYGTPTLAVQQYLDPKRTAKQLFDYKFTTLALDTSLVIFMLFAAVFGLTLLFSKNASNQGAGIVSLLLIAVLGGSIYTGIILKLTPNPKDKGEQSKNISRWLYLLLAIVIWLGGFLVLGMLPQAINPTLPPLVYIILGLVAYAGFRWNRKKSGLPGGFFAISQLSQQARLDSSKK